MKRLVPLVVFLVRGRSFKRPFLAKNFFSFWGVPGKYCAPKLNSSFGQDHLTAAVALPFS